MGLRLIEIVLPQEDGADVRELFKEHKILEHRQLRLPDGEVLVRILLEAERSEAVLDLLEKHYTDKEGNRAVILSVEATLPRANEPEPELAVPESSAPQDAPLPENTLSGRISREELYEDIKDAAQPSLVYLAMVILSTVVAAIGLYQNSVTVIIGAMVIAPLLGPNMAIALGTTLADLPLLRRATLTALFGIVTAMALSILIGVLLDIDPTSSEIASRTRVGTGDAVLALASGCAGALAFTTGVSTTLIGVMVAVALLPPLVTFGLLIGNGQWILAISALSLVLMNLICVNLAGVATFLVQGIRPTIWWEKDRAVKATYIALLLWAVLLAALLGLIWLLRKN